MDVAYRGTRLISAPQMTSMPAQYVVDRGSYQQPTWPTTVIKNPQILPGLPAWNAEGRLSDFLLIMADDARKPLHMSGCRWSHSHQ